MDNFKQRKIRNKPPKKPLSEKTKHNMAAALGIIILAFAIYLGGASLLNKLRGVRFIGLFTGIFSRDLLMDSALHTNILLLGVGGENHEGGNLTDTIIIASLDHRRNSVSMLSIPRDLHVKSAVNAVRANELYSAGKAKWGDEQALNFMQQTLSSVFEIPIHYAAKVDFKAFEEIIDTLGGVEISVEETIDDPFYPREGTFDYEPFYLAKGLRRLDGATALKYARSRKTSSDFDRSKRQQQIITAMKNAASESNSYSRKNLIKQLYYSLSKHVETNLSLGEILSLADFGSKLDSKNVVSANINDDPFSRGGFLYAPARDLYNGAFVLVPAGDSFDALQNFARLVLYGPYNLQDAPIAILNATKRNGLAGRLKTALSRFGFNFAHMGNAQTPAAELVWYFSDLQQQPLVNFLQEMLPGQAVSPIPPQYAQDTELQNAKIIAVLGYNAIPNVEKLDIFKNVVFQQAAKGTSSNAVGTQTPAMAPQNNNQAEPQ